MKSNLEPRLWRMEKTLTSKHLTTELTVWPNSADIKMPSKTTPWF